jgi:hypothetical protein
VVKIFEYGRFHRSGAIGSTIININAEPQLFLRVICVYATMDASSIGFDPSIKWFFQGEERVYDPSVAYELAEPTLPYVYAPIGAPDASLVKIELDPMAVFKRCAIITRGSVC